MTLWTLWVNDTQFILCFLNDTQCQCSTGQGFWTSRGMKAFPLERKVNLWITEESSSDSCGKGQVHAQQDQAEVASPACSTCCNAVVVPVNPLCG